MRPPRSLKLSDGETRHVTALGSLSDLNAAPRENALALLGACVERSEWVADHVVDQRPFASPHDIAQRLVDTILEAGFERRLALFRAHPELAGREAMDGKMTEASTDEQGRLGLTSLAPEVSERLRAMNSRYSDKFGHPFILALHRIPDLDAVFDIFERRLAASAVEEHVSTLAEIASVISDRVSRTFGPSTTASHAAHRIEAADV